VRADAERVRTLLAPALLLALVSPSVALADSASGGVSPGSVSPRAPSGGTSPGSVTPHRRVRGSGLVVESFSVSPSSAFIYGRPARVRFQVNGRARTIHLSLVIKRAGGHAVLRRIDLGDRPTGTPQSYSLTGIEGGPLPQGSFDLRLGARGLHGATKASVTSRFSFHWHVFPLIGQFTYGISPDGRFGASRPGHTHQGQDIPAPTGTPVVAPRGGLVKFVGFQKGGAGNYVVLHGEGENLDFVFMHLRDGSVRVKTGDTVATGEQIAEVGSTGESSGPHLHFEIWKGAWADGGQAIDPLPFLRRWDGWS
jgi:murein DD-endopeptidase MepM/ murein hydrolase activator NlpD